MTFSTFVVDPKAAGLAQRATEIQQAANRQEADVVGYQGVTPSHETAEKEATQDLVWVGAFDGDLMIGLVAFHDSFRSRNIDRLLVDPTYESQGVEQVLVESIMDAPTLTVSTGVDSLSASLYERMGFKPLGQRNMATGVVTEYVRGVT